VTVTSSATVIIKTATEPSSSKGAITTGTSTMIADLTDSNRILAASMKGSLLCIDDRHHRLSTQNRAAVFARG
jgi:hypothetical protein